MTIPNKYYVKQGSEVYTDFTTKWVGLTILKLDNFDKRGKAKNIYTQSWVNSNTEDVFIPDTVYFENPDMSISFKIDDFSNHGVNVSAVHDSFIEYMSTHKVMIKSLYLNKEATFVHLDEYEPTTKKISRGVGCNYILGTLNMHRVTATNTI